MGVTVGYAWVSTGGEDLLDQVTKFEAAGATRIFHERESGARSDRPALAKAIAATQSPIQAEALVRPILR
jgi:DNA invertase Pin-like site-specific DNA recombinase